MALLRIDARSADPAVATAFGAEPVRTARRPRPALTRDDAARARAASGVSSGGASRPAARASGRGSLRRGDAEGSSSMQNLPERTAELARGLSIAQLLAAVENELIPRLLVSHADELEARQPAPPGDPPSGPWAARREVGRFASLCAEGDVDALRERLSALLARGVGLDAIYLHLFAPAARDLGERWERDEVGFVEVQLGLCRLHQLVCECGPIGFSRDGASGERSILLAAAPGEQHTFGVALAADFFRRHGWSTENLSGRAGQEIADRVHEQAFTAAGLSLHNDELLDTLAELVGTLRARSRNPALLVLVGGDYFARHPAMVSEIGADLGAEDAHRAVLAAERALGDGASVAAAD